MVKHEAEDLWTTGDVANAIGVSTRRVRALAAHYGIGHKVGHIWVFDTDEVETLCRKRGMMACRREAR